MRADWEKNFGAVAKFFFRGQHTVRSDKTGAHALRKSFDCGRHGIKFICRRGLNVALRIENFDGAKRLRSD
jgi:hypothetical protein